ncbi:hypothetical protein [Lysinibacillus sphaericus]|nr:hypothetical protein [Lysinibacillus sphaericus]
MAKEGKGFLEQYAVCLPVSLLLRVLKRQASLEKRKAKRRKVN